MSKTAKYWSHTRKKASGRQFQSELYKIVDDFEFSWMFCSAFFPPKWKFFRLKRPPLLDTFRLTVTFLIIIYDIKIIKVSYMSLFLKTVARKFDD